MSYKIHTIKSREEIETCECFHIEQYQWNSIREPKAYGYLGYLPGEGIYVKLVCEEKEPLCRFTKNRENVYQDSAMELFLAFTNADEILTNDVFYVNLEVNSSGAIYPKAGKKSEGRAFLSDAQIETMEIHAKVNLDEWFLTYLIPEKFLKEDCGFDPESKARRLYCNFYKISETKEIEHYGSWQKLNSETPNFHLPADFIEAIIV